MKQGISWNALGWKEPKKSPSSDPSTMDGVAHIKLSSKCVLFPVSCNKRFPCHRLLTKTVVVNRTWFRLINISNLVMKAAIIQTVSAEFTTLHTVTNTTCPLITSVWKDEIYSIFFECGNSVVFVYSSLPPYIPNSSVSKLVEEN